MLRTIFCTCLLAIAILSLPLASGCHKKVTTVQQSHSVQESEPRMTSPGKEKVE